jgi:hypothetical protein
MTWKLVLNATFGTQRADATIRKRQGLFQALQAYPWYVYGPAATLPSRPGPGGAYEILGPQGDGCDGLYGNYRSRHAHFAPGSPQDVHRLDAGCLTLRAWCGLAGKGDDCNAPNIVSGILRFSQPLRPGSFVEVRCKMPVGMYAWPAFWLNTGEQKPWNADGSPGAVVSATWDAEIDIFDQYGFNNRKPGHYLIAATPTPRGPAAYARPGESGPKDLPPTFDESPAGGTMSILWILIIILLLGGGVGYGGYHTGYGGPVGAWFGGGLGLLIVVLIVLALLGRI